MRIRSAVWLLMTQVLTVLISFPMSILLARTLGPSGKGALSIVQLIAETGGLVLTLGMSSASVWLAARRQMNGRDAVRLALAFGAAGAALVLVLEKASGGAVARALFQTSDVFLVQMGAIGVGLNILVQILNGFLVGVGDIRRTSMLNATALVVQLAAYGSLAVTHRLIVPVAVVTWLTVSAGLTVSLFYLALQHAEAENAGLRGVLRAGFRFGIVTWTSSIVNYLSLRQDLFLVAYFLGVREVGVYSIAVTLAQFAMFVPNALGGVLMPKVAAEELVAQDVTMRLTRTVWPLSLLTALLIAALAGPLVPLIFGPAFRGSIAPLWLLVPAMAANGIAITLNAYLTGAGYPEDGTRAYTANFVVNVLTNVLLLPRLGISGAAIASSVSYWVGALVLIAYFRKRTGSPTSSYLVPNVTDFVELYSAVVRTVRGQGTSLPEEA